MKKTLLCIMALLLALGSAACTQSALAPEPSAQAAPVPEKTPEPEGQQKLFGKEVRIACFAPEDGLFAKGVQAQAAQTGIALDVVASLEEAVSADALIVCGAAPASLSDASQPIILYTEENEAARGNVYLLRYAKETETNAALDAMFGYPSHEAPVRILGLFTSQQSEAYKAYMQMEAEGKLQSKGVFFENEIVAAQDAALAIGSDGQTAQGETEAAAWLVNALAGITIGVLDTVYAETPALAMQGFAALKGAARNDAVEICAAGLSEAQITAMQEEHFLMGTAVGANEYGAGMLALRMAISVLAGEAVEQVTETAPCALYSDDVFALKKEGITSADELLTSLDASLAALCDTASVHELAEYYGA